MNVTIDKQSVLYNQPSVTQTQSIFIWPIRAIRRHFDAGSMSFTPCSSLHFSNSKTSSGHHCCLQVLWFATTATRPGTGVLLFPQFKMPLSPCCSSPVHERLAPSCKPNLPFLGNETLVLCCSPSNLNKFFLHVLVVWQKTSEVSSKHVQSASSTPVKGRFDNSCTKIGLKLSSERQMNKKMQQTLLLKIDNF